MLQITNVRNTCVVLDSSQSYKLSAVLIDIQPISRLPDEVLVEVFLILRDWSLKTDGNWFIVTHVCRRWRNVAIDFPRLWSVPDLCKHSFYQIKTFLERAKAAPLTIDNTKLCLVESAEDACSTCDKVLAIALQQLPRARVLELKNCAIDDIEVTYDIPAPILEELGIHFIPNVGDVPIELSPRFLRDSTPPLRQVHLWGCIFSYSMRTRLFHDLTHLSIFDHYEKNDHYVACESLYPDVEELLQILNSCPKLIEVMLSICKPSTSRQDAHVKKRSLQKVSPLHVQKLAILEMSIQTAGELFHYLEIPNSREMVIGIRYDASTQTQDILSVLPKLCRGEIHDDLVLRFRRFTTCFDFHGFDDKGHLLYKLCLMLFHIDESGFIEDYSDPLKVTSTVADLLRNGVWDHTTRLGLNPGPFYAITADLWSIVFRAIPEVTQLILDFVEEARKHSSTAKDMNEIFLGYKR